MQLSKEFKQAVLTALEADRNNYGGSDTAFAKKWGINNAVYSRLKSGETDGLLKEGQWLNIGRELQVSLTAKKWNVARTKVYADIEDNLQFCKEFSKSMLLVDDTAIGKTFCSRHIIRGMKNTFYVDCSESKTKQLFIRTLAKTIGVDNTGKYSEVKANLKYYLKQLEKPLIVLDEAGDLDYPAFLELKELWNATEGVCGYYLMGADGLEAKIYRGINCKKVGYREIFSRFNNQFIHIVPRVISERVDFYKGLIADVLTVNAANKTLVPNLVKQCMSNDDRGNIGGLRRAETLLLISEN